MKLNYKLRTTVMVCVLAFGVSALLIGCGGGSSSTTAASSSTLTGTIASGAPYPLGTTITAYDKNGLVAATTTTTDDTGNYSITIPAGKQTPFVFAASAPDLDTLYSFSATGASGTVNITPITNLIAARLSPTGNPENLSANTSQITATAVAAQIQAVVNVLAPAAAATGDTVTNPMTAPFTANGTGHDRLLDALKIKITPTTAGGNADVTFVTTAAPIVIPTFPASASTTATIPPLQNATTGATVVTGTIASTDVVVSGTAVKVKDFVTRLQACFDTPFASRVVANGSTSADITAAACRTLFLGDDPANYKNNGFRVGIYSNGNNWTGIFRAGTGTRKWDLGRYEYTLANGDIAVSWRSKEADGSDVRYSTVVTRMVGTAPNEQLKVIGNQYDYDADIKPQIHQRVFANDSTYNYKATGYSLYVENKQTNGAPAFNRVEITTQATPTNPSGVKFTLKPTSSYSYLVLVNPNGTLNNAGTVMLNLTSIGGTDKATIIAKTPNDYLWAPTGDWSDANISSLGQQTTWTLNYFNAGNTGTTPDATETRRTIRRAPTLAELESQSFAEFTSTFLTETRASTSANNSFTFQTEGKADISTTGIQSAWQVPTGALAPTSLSLFGRAPYINNGSGGDVSSRFNDVVNFSSTARLTVVSCSKQSNTDLHCATADPTNYAIGVRVNYLSLSNTGPGNIAVTSGMGTYKPSLNP